MGAPKPPGEICQAEPPLPSTGSVAPRSRPCARFQLQLSGRTHTLNQEPLCWQVSFDPSPSFPTSAHILVLTFHDCHGHGHMQTPPTCLPGSGRVQPLPCGVPGQPGCVAGTLLAACTRELAQKDNAHPFINLLCNFASIFHGISGLPFSREGNRQRKALEPAENPHV